MATKKAAKKKSSSAKKTSSRKSTSKKSSAKKTSSRKSAGKKSSAKKSSKSSTRKYSPSAGKNVEREMHAMKRGKLRSGTGKKVTNPKQAIAIGLSEARRSGKKVPKKKS